eukprot:1629700-Rhodomonas_salina.1
MANFYPAAGGPSHQAGMMGNIPFPRENEASAAGGDGRPSTNKAGMLLQSGKWRNPRQLTKLRVSLSKQRTRAAEACSACKVQKRKCDAGRPCRECERRGIGDSCTSGGSHNAAGSHSAAGFHQPAQPKPVPDGSWEFWDFLAANSEFRDDAQYAVAHVARPISFPCHLMLGAAPSGALRPCLKIFYSMGFNANSIYKCLRFLPQCIWDSATEVLDSCDLVAKINSRSAVCILRAPSM